jgi:hypothetical protein
LNQNLSHQLGANRKEMCAVLKVHRLLLRQTEIGFVYESGGLQRVVWTLFSDVVMSYSTEFVVHQRYEAAQRFLITVPVFGQ